MTTPQKKLVAPSPSRRGRRLGRPGQHGRWQRQSLFRGAYALAAGDHDASRVLHQPRRVRQVSRSPSFTDRAGAAWLPSLLWRFDAEYKGLRREVPWLKRLPSEYVAEHVWLTTQPLEASPRREQLIDLLGWVNGAERLVYSSDYPHWDADEVNHVSARSETLWRGVEQRPDVGLAHLGDAHEARASRWRRRRE